MQSESQSQVGYDRGVITFSPDGRLFQVEYAREAVKRGTTAVGIKAIDGAVLLVDKRVTSKLLEAESIEKIFQIDDHIGAATSGLVTDGRVIIDLARNEAQINKITYDEPIDTYTLVKKVCDHKQLYTQNGGFRPFGVALLVLGINDGKIKLFETDPSGVMLEYKAAVIGTDKTRITEILENEYNDNITIEDAIVLGINVLKNTTEKKFDISNIDIGIIHIEENVFNKLHSSEVKEIYENLITV